MINPSARVFKKRRRQGRAARRANGQKSRGPIIPEGKAKPRYNPLKHGIDAKQQVMFSESAEDLAQLAAEYHELYISANVDERYLVDTLINNEWRLRRLRARLTQKCGSLGSGTRRLVVQLVDSAPAVGILYWERL
jgi:hypothetical protein